MDYRAELLAAQRSVNTALDGYFNESCPQSELLEAMRYSLLSPGKRIRGILLIKFCEACGGEAAWALPAACGVEMFHAYSLIHDDLPCMDDDDLRRGRPTCHKVFGETTAVIAGDALQCAAFQTVLSAPVAAERLAAMAKALACAGGEQGMCGGQQLDTCNENSVETEEELRQIHALKTGALLRAACVMGVYCAGGTEEQLRAAEIFAENVGLAFQIRDDVLDCTASEAELGKDIGSDADNGKTTYVTLFGAEKCAELVHEYTERACRALDGKNLDGAFLSWLARELADRKK